METKSTKKDDFTKTVLLKVSREKIKSFDSKQLNLLLDIIALLSTAKMKSISEFNQFIQDSRPELIEQREIKNEANF